MIHAVKWCGHSVHVAATRMIAYSNAANMSAEVKRTQVSRTKRDEEFSVSFSLIWGQCQDARQVVLFRAVLFLAEVANHVGATLVHFCTFNKDQYMLT